MLYSTKAGQGFKTLDANLTNELKDLEIDPQDRKNEKPKPTSEANSAT